MESPLKFDGEFDFEEANAQFDKDEIERELKEKLTIGKLQRNSIVSVSRFCWKELYHVPLKLLFKYIFCVVVKTSLTY